MKATWRPLTVWPYTSTEKRKSSQFRTSWARSLTRLENELERMDATDPEIAIVATNDQFTLAGLPKASLRVLHPGAVVTFDSPKGRLTFHTDVFPYLHDNLHAIAAGLEALRAVDRYGITSGTEQWSGFALTAGGPDPARGKVLVERAGSLRKALMQHHPDHGGLARDFADVQAYRDSVGGQLT